MALSYDSTKYAITLPRGDTFTMPITLTGTVIDDGDKVIFRVYDMILREWVLTKVATVSNKAVSIRFASADTKSLNARKKYGWTIGIAKDIVTNTNGMPYADDTSDAVVTAFDDLKPFIVTDSGVLGDV